MERGSEGGRKRGGGGNVRSGVKAVVWGILRGRREGMDSIKRWGGGGRQVDVYIEGLEEDR